MNITATPIRIVLVDSQPGAMGNIKTALGLSPALQLVGQAADSQEAIQLCQRILPEVVLVNLAAPDLEGTSVVRLLTHQWPQITVLALSDAGETEKLRAALDAGASGYLPNDADPETLAGTIEHVIAGRRKAAPASNSTAGGSKAAHQPELPDPVVSRATELAEAARIQSSLLPDEPPAIPGWDSAVKLLPARETSGDFFDFLSLEYGRLGVVVGDVSDKGLGAALFMAMTSTLFRTYISRQPSLPGLTMSAVNERIISDSGGSSFVTAFLGVLEPNTGRFRYVSAGHVPALLFSAAKGNKIERLNRTGMALGILPGASWQQKLVKFVPGDFLLLYTDGVLDAQNSRGEFYGEPRLVQAARSLPGGGSGQIVDAILDDIHDFTGAAPLSDDQILMVLSRRKA